MAHDGTSLLDMAPAHGVGFYASDEEFTRTFVPFCEAGLKGGDRTVVRLDERKADLVRTALGDATDIEFLAHEDQYSDPPAALQALLDLVAAHDTRDARPVRILGELPPMTGLSRDAWLRYEATANHVLEGFAVYTLCAFDSRIIPSAVQTELLRTHPLITTPEGLERNDRYESPESFIANRSQDTSDPLEHGPPDLELVDPSASAVRRAVAHLAANAHLEAEAAQNLVFAANEALTNALVHGQRPCWVRGWCESGRAVVVVADAGPGPQDPFAGLLPGRWRQDDGGRGLWMTHRLCPEVALSSTENGFTLRLAAGTPGGQEHLEI